MRRWVRSPRRSRIAVELLYRPDSPRPAILAGRCRPRDRRTAEVEILVADPATAVRARAGNHFSGTASGGVHRYRFQWIVVVWTSPEYRVNQMLIKTF